MNQETTKEAYRVMVESRPNDIAYHVTAGTHSSEIIDGSTMDLHQNDAVCRATMESQ